MNRLKQLIAGVVIWTLTTASLVVGNSRAESLSTSKQADKDQSNLPLYLQHANDINISGIPGSSSSCHDEAHGSHGSHASHASHTSGTADSTYVPDTTSTATQTTSSCIDIHQIPVSGSYEISMDEGTALNFAFQKPSTASVDFAYTVTLSPIHGKLTVDADGERTYTPETRYSGSDTFRFKASDGVIEYNEVIITLNIRHIQHDPVAKDSSVGLHKDTPRLISLNAQDVDGNQLNYRILINPLHGILTPTKDPAVYLFTPKPGFSGPDQFVFVANDGRSDSRGAKVAITVTAKDVAPVASDQNFVVTKDTKKEIILGATDFEDDPIAYTIVDQPKHGQLVQLSNDKFIFKPEGGYCGHDEFTFKANDGFKDSSTAQVTLLIGEPTDQGKLQVEG